MLSDTAALHTMRVRVSTLPSVSAWVPLVTDVMVIASTVVSAGSALLGAGSRPTSSATGA